MKYIVLLTAIAIITIIITKSSIASSVFPSTAASQQLIVVIADSWHDLKARMYRFERSEKVWRKLPGHFDAVIGSNGLAWGIGLAEKNEGAPVKKEGDRKAPAGIFHLVKAMGYAQTPPSGVAFPYEEIKEKTHCVDDKESRYYNQIIKESDLQAPAADLWKSSELMKRKDILYKWLLVVDYNKKDPAPGAGSCIFIHVWRSPEKGTAGCTALAEKDVIELMTWLKSEDEPVLVQLPKASYDRYWKEWDLPAPESLSQ